jgi:hypothetical protein
MVADHLFWNVEQDSVSWFAVGNFEIGSSLIVAGALVHIAITNLAACVALLVPIMMTAGGPCSTELLQLRRSIEL